MYKFLSILLLLTGTVSMAVAQDSDVQWASTIIDYSSEMSPRQYSAAQILGRPDVPTGAGESPNAWTPRRPDKEEFIKVGYANPMQIRQVAIAENFNPSAVSRVYTYDAEGNEYLMVELEPTADPERGRMLNVFSDITPHKVAAVKVVFDGEAVPGYYSVDAIGISSSPRPVAAEINVLPNVNPEVVVDRLGPNVNSDYDELKPLLSPDGNILYFSRQNHPENVGGTDDMEDIWYSEKQPDGSWSIAKNAGSPLNNEAPNFISSITPDGNSAIILLGNEYLPNGKMRAGVSISNRQGDSWSEPEALEIENNYNLNEQAGFFIAQNRKVLIMSIERDDTRGDRDLYVSFREEDGTWTEPANLGDVINTASVESAPFLAPDNRTLYFSSKGFSGFGNLDIYTTTRLDDTWLNWSEPQNLGPGINSTEDDVFFTLPLEGDKSYFSRGNKGENVDIFRLELPTFYKPDPVVKISGIVYNSKSNEPTDAQIFYENLTTGAEVGMAEVNPETGDYTILLPYGYLYGYRAEKEGFLSKNENIDLREVSEYREMTRNLYLTPAEINQVVRLNNIFFDFDKAVLKAESKPELNRVAEFLKENSGIRILISGHTDAIGTEAYNQELSERRAAAVSNYLQQQGIGKQRLDTQGFGESKPIATNEQEEDGRELNRRVELKVVGE